MVESRVIKNKGVTLPPRDEEGPLPWLALARVNGLGSAGFKRVVEHFGSPRRAFSATESELAQVPDLDRRAIDGLLTFAGWDEVKKEIQRTGQNGIDIVPLADSLYPPRLGAISDPPPVLYVKGRLTPSDQSAVAVVGSRSASDYGIRITQELCHGLGGFGVTVISGMARGIDAAAHESTLAVGGRTIAVLGSGIDVVYPPEHVELYNRIASAGAILSELPLGTPPLSFNFPSRNRIISGLSLGVVVVEATEKSGSLITASLALEQGREVFAVPGPAGASRSRGTHQLIRQGAKLVERVEDILEEISPQIVSRRQTAKTDAMALSANMGADTRTVFEMVLGGPRHIDEVIQGTGLSAGKVSAILLDLEIRGFLKQLPGKRFTGIDGNTLWQPRT